MVKQPKLPLKQKKIIPWWKRLKPWEVRNYIIDCISRLLIEKRTNASQEWIDKLPRIAKRLEEVIYKQSAKLKNYAKLSTLKLRLQRLAICVKNKKQAKAVVSIDTAISAETAETAMSAELGDVFKRMNLFDKDKK
jgi:hypothetical protein